MMPLIEDTGISMLARIGFFFVKFFLLLIPRELNDRVRDQSATEGDSHVHHVSSYTYNVLNPSVSGYYLLFYS